MRRQPKWLRAMGNTADGAYIVDEEQRIICWNQAAEKLLGYSASEVLNRKCYQIIAGRLGNEAFCRRNCRVRLCAQSGIWLPNFDLHVCRKDGQAIRVNLSTVTLPVRDKTLTLHLLRDSSRPEKSKQATEPLPGTPEEGGNASLRSDSRPPATGRVLVGFSPAIQRVRDLVEQVASSMAPVLIEGETGTGKELVAEAIHQAGRRSSQPFIKLNCAALPDTLLEGELFGYESGAFTGAQHRRKGIFEMADGGTLFLDQISDISLKTQVNLLRVLQEKEFTRLGCVQPIKVDFRCITATNKNLEELVKKGRFRSDLFYRLHVIRIQLPPLRECREDIPILTDHFLRKYAAALNKPCPRLSAAALDLLVQYDWPGNARELENAVERAFVLGRKPELRASDFQFESRGPDLGGGGSLEDVTRAHIERILEATDWNLSRAARLLEINRSTLYNKLRRYGLKRDSAVPG